MTIEIFKKQLITKLQEFDNIKEWQITGEVFVKNNDTACHAIVFRQTDSPAAPTIYIDELYEDYLDKKFTISEMAEKIKNTLQKSKEHVASYESLTFDYESCRDKIIYHLVSGKNNSHILETSPYIPFLDFAITFYIVCNCSENGVESIRITNELFEQWGIRMKELMDCADINTPFLFPAKMEKLEKVLLEYLEDQDEEIPEGFYTGESSYGVLILTNKQGVNGASALLYPELIHEIADRYESDLYLIPSSVHEFLILPAKDSMELSELTTMIQQVNKNHVYPDEILSDHAYLYRREDKKFYF